ncbi:YigZ family protein [Vibrio sp. F74]|uniref:YigZ family protein n=1 Tax=Vibrio sp. F74 TaxID=700020 RepID=UPI0035F5E388
MNDQPYRIPAESVEFEEEIKKSFFITQLAHAPTIEAAKSFIEEVKGKHSGARHHCWAFVAGRADDSMMWGFSDDGEPSGTAGKPILAQLSGSGVGEMVAVVTRYSGGIKLGTGGLVKAYGGGVQQALKRLQTLEKKINTQLQLRLDYSFMPLLKNIMAQYEASALNTEFFEQIEMTLEIEKRQVSDFTLSVINKSGARIIVSQDTATPMKR